MANKQATSHPRGAAKEQLKDPKGGLTAAGRKHFKETEGANLRPGVKQVKSAEDMKRKGSFLRRHYARAPSPLTDDHGEPTRYAKQAAAWGEPVPKTNADVKRLAQKGKQLLDRYHEETANGGDGGESSKRAATAKPRTAKAKPRAMTVKSRAVRAKPRTAK